LHEYTRAIELFLNSTELPILVVESSGYHFNISHKRFRQHAFNGTQQLASSTQQEAASILRAFDVGLLDGFAKIIKVTGKYYLPDLEKEIKEIPAHACIIYQQTHAVGRNKWWRRRAWQNSEVFGFCSEFVRPIFGPIARSTSCAMEHALVDMHLALNTSSYRLPALRIQHKVRRGDGSVLVVL
jgi:hypothetical protein